MALPGIGISTGICVGYRVSGFGFGGLGFREGPSLDMRQWSVSLSGINIRQAAGFEKLTPRTC